MTLPKLGRGDWALACVAVAGVLVILVAMGLGTLADRSQAEHERRVDRVAATATAHTRVETLLLDVESGLRGYLLTGRSAFLEPYDASIEVLPGALDELDRLAAGDTSQRQWSQRIRTLAEAKVAHARSTMELFSRGSEEEALARVSRGRGKVLMDRLRDVVADAQVDAQAQLATSAQRARTTEMWARVVGTGAAVLLLLLLVTMVRLVGLRAHSERRRLAAEAGRDDLAAELAHHLVHDPLTRLPNRRLLEDRLEQAVTRLPANDSLLAVLYIDIDRFKQVNDRHGHAAGDRVLVALAQRLRSALGPTDTIARLGADQFGALCEGLADRTAAMSVVAAVQEQAAQRATAGASGIPLTVSVGVVLVDSAGVRVEDGAGEVAMADPGMDGQSLIAAAEDAMYGAKELGRGRHQTYTMEVARRRFQRTALVGDLREALAGNTSTGGRLWVAYQPLVGLPHGRPVGVEALARWTHPQLGEVSPAQFIPLAEEAGLITALGELVTEAACKQAAVWNARRAQQGQTRLYMSVNCSASQLLDAHAVDRLGEILRTHGLSAGDLVLEVTESVLVDTVSGAAERLHAIAATGVRLALDDFGTGYSSLAYLRRFPFDVVKIDRSFAAGLGRREDDEAIVSAIVAMATSMRCTVIVEGIETAEQARHAARLGCPQAQGYHFARPGPPEALEAQLLAVPGRAPLTARR